MVTLTTTCAILLVLSGIAKAVKDTLSHHYQSSVFSKAKYEQSFWNTKISWLNKWKNNNIQAERFWGSSRWFAWTTDAWHLFDTIGTTCMQSAGLLPVMYFYNLSFWYFIPALCVVKMLVGVPFEVCYSKLFKR